MTIPIQSPPEQQSRLAAEKSARGVRSRSPAIIQPGRTIYPPYVLAPNSTPLNSPARKRESELRGHELQIEGYRIWNTLLSEIGVQP